jgi:RNA polymerase sigma-70 factor (ECF subfamily)
MIVNDLELYEKIKKGNEFAFESLFRSYYKSLCFFCFKIVKDTSIAEEIVQDFFFHFWEKREVLILNSSVKSYLFKSVYNNALKYLRHEKIIQEHENYVKMQDDTIQLPDNYAETGEMMHIINRTLSQAPQRTREIFELNRYKGLKYQEIADKLDISVKTVEAHITSLLKTLRLNLKDYLSLFAFVFLNFFIG